MENIPIRIDIDEKDISQNNNKENEKDISQKNMMSPELQKTQSDIKEQKTKIVATINGVYRFERMIDFLKEILQYLVFSLWIFVSCMIWTSDIACYFPENTIINVIINGILPFCNNNGYVYYNWCILVFVSIPLGIFLRCRDKIINTLLNGKYMSFSSKKIGLLRRNIFICLCFNLEKIRIYLSNVQNNFGDSSIFKHFIFKIDDIKEMHTLLRTKLAKIFLVLILSISIGIFLLSFVLQIINQNHFINIIGLLPFKIYSFLFILKCYECIKYEDIISCANRDINHLQQSGQQNARFEVSNERFMSHREDNIKKKFREKIQILLEEKRLSYDNLSENDLAIDFDASDNILLNYNIKYYNNDIPDDKINEMQILCQLLKYHNKYYKEDDPDIFLTIQDFDEYAKYEGYEERLKQELSRNNSYRK